jgi:trehalose/maltose transport system substrate-binding protein
MRHSQRDRQNKLIRDMRMRRLSRRVFLQRAQEVGLSSSIVALLLDACATSATAPTSITWYSGGEVNASQAFSELVQHFNAVNEHNIFVNQHPILDNTLYNKLFAAFSAHQGQPEVLSVDVVWMSKFAANRWIIPLDPYWTEQQRKNYLAVPLKAASYENKQWGAPLYTDAGVLFYRTDLPEVIDVARLTLWRDFIQMARAAQTKLGMPYGFAWQAKQFEGLVCNFVEILSAYGGAIVDDVHNPHKVIVGTNSGALEALTAMTQWVQTISPDIINDIETDTTNKWISGKTAFMRNWPGAISDSKNNAKSQVSEKFDVSKLPAPAIPCLGGWQLAINSYAESAKQDAAWEFISWMLQEDAQQYMAVKDAFAVTLASIYDDPSVQQANPFYSSLKSSIDHAQFRPIAPHYQCLANEIELHVHRALADQTYLPARALQDLQIALEKVLEKKPTEEDDCVAPY